MPYGAIRAGDFKLIEFYDGRSAELYQLRDDVSEQRNLATAMPEKVRELSSRLERWRREVGAQMPAKNPDYDSARPEHDPNWRKKA